MDNLGKRVVDKILYKGKYSRDVYSKSKEDDCESCRQNDAVYFNDKTGESICRDCFDHRMNVLDETRFRPNEWVVK